mmetsp:Transcript_21413/g.31779  ORF Transcript_21413/g.31779 Transcript_21413/m.31779 type:complete len:431 (-) Transcript_21413:1457-2749(-)
MTRIRKNLHTMIPSSCISSSSTDVTYPASESTPLSRSKGSNASRVMVVIKSSSSTNGLLYACSPRNNALAQSRGPLQEEVEVCHLPSHSHEQSALAAFDACSTSPASDYTMQYDVKADFAPSTWKEILDYNSMPLFSAVLATATVVVVHPLVFFAGAATAVWAVGVFHAVEQGYQFISDGAFRQLFWEDKEKDIDEFNDEDGEISNYISPLELNSLPLESILSTVTGYDPVDSDSAIDVSREHLDGSPLSQHLDESPLSQVAILKTNSSISTIAVEEETKVTAGEETKVAAEDAKNDKKNTVLKDESEISLSKPKMPSHVPLPPRTDPTPKIVVDMKTIDAHFPPLETQVTEAVKFPGLHVLDFFSVFFSNDAPYGMKEFQKTLGDVDIIYGDWMPVSKEDRLGPSPVRRKAQQVKKGAYLVPSSFVVFN